MLSQLYRLYSVKCSRMSLNYNIMQALLLKYAYILTDHNVCEKGVLDSKYSPSTSHNYGQHAAPMNYCSKFDLYCGNNYSSVEGVI
jgi:hypothetical protein